MRKLQQSSAPSSTATRTFDTSEPSFSINAQLLWDLLIYDRAVLPDAGSRHFTSSSRIREPVMLHGEGSRDTTPFELVGSAGISGHLSVSAHIPIYASDEESFGNSAEPPQSWWRPSAPRPAVEQSLLGCVQFWSGWDR